MMIGDKVRRLDFPKGRAVVRIGIGTIGSIQAILRDTVFVVWNIDSQSVNRSSYTRSTALNFFEVIESRDSASDPTCIPTHCHGCKEMNHSDAPANSPGNKFVCGRCRSYLQMAPIIQAITTCLQIIEVRDGVGPSLSRVVEALDE